MLFIFNHIVHKHKFIIPTLYRDRTKKMYLMVVKRPVGQCLTDIGHLLGSAQSILGKPT
jgi:hypothetical protein